MKLLRVLLLVGLPHSCFALVGGTAPTTATSIPTTSKDPPVDPTEEKAFPLQTPHSGRHFLPSHPAYRRSFWRNLLPRRHRRKGRFTEGWYYRLTLPEHDVSFAFIISIEDAGRRPPSPLRLSCIQLVGPNDGYIVQGVRDDTLFWAWEKQQGLGCTFQFKPEYDTPEMKSTTALSIDEWKQKVESGFQMLPNHLIGRVRGRDGTQGSLVDDDDGKFESRWCDFEFSIEPLCGWGDADGEQKSTGGWLASFPVFEPHWQVTLADARATGRVVWNNQTYDFENVPFYAEKNWGAALPKKWYWTQCNSFDGYDQLSVTAGGGIRKIPFGRREALGMVSVHYNGKFYEAVPWTGAMTWKVATWGSWELKGNCTFGERPFEVEISYKVDPAVTPGLVFRAPTPDEGLVRFCRDTFEAKTTLSLWELEWNKQRKCYERKPGPPLIDRATSRHGGVEVGGSPWWDEWVGESLVKQPIRSLLRVPYKVQRLQNSIRRRVFQRSNHNS